MPYDPTFDRTLRFDNTNPTTAIMQARRMTSVSQDPNDLPGYLPKALWVYVVPATAGPHITITPAANADTDLFSLTLNDGWNIIDAVKVRRVTYISGGVSVYRLDDE